MAKYIIKDNLPIGKRHEEIWKKESSAKSAFLAMAGQLAERYSVKTYFRNRSGKDLRGTIQVDIDGFYYYVELFRDNK